MGQVAVAVTAGANIDEGRVDEAPTRLRISHEYMVCEANPPREGQALDLAHSNGRTA